MKKILIVVTNVSKYKDFNRATGLWLGEAIHFYDEVVSAGYEVDFVSPKGGYVPLDPHSFKYATDTDWKWYTNEEFVNQAFTNTLKPEHINSDDYIAIYYTGGHGVIWDFKDNEPLQKIAQKIYSNQGYVTSVCHGAAGLINIKDDKGEYLIKDKVITGFSNLEERINRTHKKVPFYTEDELKKRGAIYKKTLPFKEYVIVDGRLITGQNPMSPKKVAQELIKCLESK